MANTSVSTQALIDEAKGTNFYEAAKAIEASTNTYYEQIEAKAKANTDYKRKDNFLDLYEYDPITNSYTVKSKAKTYEYPYKGRKNETDFPEFIQICKLSAKKLKQYLCGEMKKIYGKDNTVIGDGYIYCRGDVPVLLTAHMDTVHKKLVTDFYEDIQTDKNGKVTHTISSPQGIGGDDRCGIYAILKVIESGYLPYVLFCEDEEIGGIGSGKFCKTKYITELSNMKFLIELDGGINPYYGLLEEAIESGVVVKQKKGVSNVFVRPKYDTDGREWKEKELYCAKFWVPVFADDAFNDFLERKFSFEETVLTSSKENLNEMIAAGDWDNLPDNSLTSKQETETPEIPDEDEPFTFDVDKD